MTELPEVCHGQLAGGTWTIPERQMVSARWDLYCILSFVKGTDLVWAVLDLLGFCARRQ